MRSEQVRASQLGVWLLLASTVGCESNAEVLDGCHTTCDQLAAEYAAQCTGAWAEACRGDVEEHHESCLRDCDVRAANRRGIGALSLLH